PLHGGTVTKAFHPPFVAAAVGDDVDVDVAVFVQDDVNGSVVFRVGVLETALAVVGADLHSPHRVAHAKERGQSKDPPSTSVGTESQSTEESRVCRHASPLKRTSLMFVNSVC